MVEFQTHVYVADWSKGAVNLNDTLYTAETDGTLFIQCDLGQWCTWTVNGVEYKIGGSVGGHMFDFRVGKGTHISLQQVLLPH